jgi:hypothetical protein
MTRCNGIKKDGNRCNFNAKSGLFMCGVHARQSVPEVVQKTSGNINIHKFYQDQKLRQAMALAKQKSIQS